MLYIRTIALLILLIAGMSVTARAQDTLVLSPRIGSTLDAEERRYFQLFPGLEQNGDIVFVSRSDGQVVVLDGEQRIGLLNSAQHALLRRYIAEYDSLRMADRTRTIARTVNDRFEALWESNVIAPYESWEGETVQVIARSGPDTVAVKGELLWADRDRLYVLPEGSGDAGVPLRIASERVLSIGTFSSAPGKGALIGAGVGAGLGLILGIIATSSGYYDSGERVAYTVLLTVMASVPFAVIGTIIGLATTTEDRNDIPYPYYYHNLLPNLQNIMYYRHGLPPDSPLRDN